MGVGRNTLGEEGSDRPDKRPERSRSVPSSHWPNDRLLRTPPQSMMSKVVQWQGRSCLLSFVTGLSFEDEQWMPCMYVCMFRIP